MFWYLISIVIRLVWTLIYPQRGYIHPDEFFQGPQIVFDDLFQANLTRTHEFQGNAPLRSVAILYLLYGLPVWILSNLQRTPIPFYWKLIAPRMTIVLLSFLTDFLFYRLISLLNLNIHRKVLMNYYGLSYVTLVFFTRTLSNSFEAFLFLALIYFIQLNLTSNTVQKSKGEKISNQKTIISSIFIGFICALGLFNRPTFPMFAVVPIVYWLINVFFTREQSIRIERILPIIIGTFVVTCSSLILFDTFYYTNEYSLDLHRLVICPWNFLRYNSDAKNLNEHGLHPRWLHFVVNAFLLFGPLHVCAVLRIFSALSNVKQWISTFGNSETKKSLSGQTMLVYLYFVPFLPLSIIPHQEARFLLPLVFPLILLVVPRLIESHRDRSIFPLWFLFNAIVGLLYGHLHQGGLLPALDHVHHSVSNSSIQINYLLTYHTYMPVDYLVVPMSKSSMTKLSIIDLQGAPSDRLHQTINDLLTQQSIDKFQLFVLLPRSRRIDLNEEEFQFDLFEQFSFHLDFDHSPNDLWSDSKIDLYRIKHEQ